MKKILLIPIALVIIALFPIKEACGGKGVCRTGPIPMGDTIQSCIFYEVKPALLVLLDSANMRIPFYYNRIDECS